MKDENWFDLIVQSYHGNVEANGLALPGFPSDEICLNTTGAIGETTLREAFEFYQDIKTLSHEWGTSVDEGSSLLDFGAGWGRITRFFLNEINPENIVGIDVDENLVNISNECFNSVEFKQVDSFPPVSLPDESFSHIVGYSVFSHLSEESCNLWINEFLRLLKPGGVLALTTRGKNFANYCAGLPDDSVGYQNELKKMVGNGKKLKKRLDDGEFVFFFNEAISGSKATRGGSYGETFISKGYMETKWSSLFSKCFYYDKRFQPILLFKK